MSTNEYRDPTVAEIVLEQLLLAIERCESDAKFYGKVSESAAFDEAKALLARPEPAAAEKAREPKIVSDMSRFIIVELHAPATLEERKAMAQRIALALPSPPAATGETKQELCYDCPPVGYPTDKTRCAECPRGAK